MQTCCAPYLRAAVLDVVSIGAVLLATGGSAVFGLVMAASFFGGATGYALAPMSRRVARGSTRWAVARLSVLSGLTLPGVASARMVVLAEAAQRATVVSAWSLALQAGGAASSLVGLRFGGTGRAYALAGVLAGLAGLLALGLPRDMPGSPEHGAPQDVADEDRR